MKHVMLSALLVCGFASMASAQDATEKRDSIFLHAVVTGVGITAAGDVFTTGVAFGALPKAYEKNLALRWTTNSAAGLGLVKGAIAVGQVEGFVWLHKQGKWGRVLTYAIGAGTIGMNSYAIRHNAKLVQRR